MKRIKITYLAAIIVFLSFTFTTCVEDKDFDIPTPQSMDEPNLTGLNFTTFKAVKATYEQAIANGNNTVTFQNNEYLTGYVVSSDEAGNFYEELIIQNSADGNNPEEAELLGFRIGVNLNGLHQFFDFGRKVYIKLNGLTVGIKNGVLNIGKGADLNQIQSFEYQDIILRSLEIASVTPKTMLISEFSTTRLNTYVQVLNTQFFRNDVGLTYAGEPDDEYDGFRTIESCEENATIILETSTFADFKSLVVNPNKGSISGILSRDFGDDFNVLKINSISNIAYTETTRCDPVELNCGLATTAGTNIVFEDTFETQTTGAPITGNGWTNYIEAGTEMWEAYTASGANASQGISARMGAYFSGEDSNIAWLITPQIDLDASSNTTLSFQTSTSFADDSKLELLFSNNWDGTTTGVTTATWGIVPAAYIVQNSDSFASWFSSGIVDLSCTSGKVHIAFKYTGSGDTNFDGTYELDEVKITSN